MQMQLQIPEQIFRRKPRKTQILTEQLNFKLPCQPCVCVCLSQVLAPRKDVCVCVCLKSLNLLTELMRKVRFEKDKGKVEPDGKVSKRK